MSRRVSAARVKSHRSYTVEEAAEAVGVTAPTVRDWIRRGMTAMIQQRPTLILGAHLKAFIVEARTKKIGPMPTGQFFCLRCKTRTEAAMGLADYHPLSEHHGRLEAFCARCEGTCSRIISRPALADWAQHCRIEESLLRHA